MRKPVSDWPSAPTSLRAHVKVWTALYLAIVAWIGVFYFSNVSGIAEVFDTPFHPLLVGRDFLNFWTIGHVVEQGALSDIYEPVAYRDHMIRLFQDQPDLKFGGYAYSYPPHSIFAFGWLSWFSYPVALILFSLMGILSFFFSLKVTFKSLPPAALGLIAPASFICLWSGQVGLIVSALIILGLHWLKPRPILAGICIGLLTIKPQFGPLILLVLLMGRHWAVIISASITAMSLIAASIALMGIDPWMVYFNEVLGFQAGLLDKSIGAFDYMVPSAYKSLVLLGLSAPWPGLAQALSLVAAIALTVRATLNPDLSRNIWMACVIIGMILFTPYIALYDLPLLGFCVLALAQSHLQRGTFSLMALTVLAVIATMPVYHFLFSLFGAPVGLLFLVGIYWALWREVSRTSETAVPD